MTDQLPISPDESGPEPRCVATCPRRDDHDEVATLCGVSAVMHVRLCRSDGDKESVYDRDVCLPRVRKYKEDLSAALSRISLLERQLEERK